MKLSTQILLAFSIVLILSIIDTTSNYLLSLKVKQNTEFLSKSQEIIRNSARLHKSIIEMQSSFRGFLLTKDTNFLDNYEVGLHEIPTLMKEQRELVLGNAKQVTLLDSINTLHLAWIKYVNTLINSRTGNHTNQASFLPFSSEFESRLKEKFGKRINDDITNKFIAFDKIEYELRRKHSNNLINSIQQTHRFSILFFALTIVIGILTTSYIVSLISKRIKTMANLAESISKGEFTTLHDTHKDELTSLSSSLNIMSARLKKNITELENRNAELDKFAYVVSHDLKAPVRGIHNVIKWIQEDLDNELSPEMKKYLNIIPQRTKRMESLINGLLDYARLREKTVPELIDLNLLVNEIVETIVPRNFEVQINTLPVINTERIKLEQIFTNLISNAVKYTQNSHGKIKIDCIEIPDYYEFSVADNGIGIESEYHEKIFEIFQTLREKDEKESTGLGLAIIKKILEDRHCTIRINSELGKGSEFIFTWPRKQSK